MRAAILYRTKPAPSVGGVKKPMKEGGYSDSGADIAYELKRCGYEPVLPCENPSVTENKDWVFGDDTDGIRAALDAGAQVLWLNTVLYSGHPIEEFIKNGVHVIGQRPSDVQKYDDKLFTNNMLRDMGLPVVKSCLSKDYDGGFPCVVKPIRGRGSQGVTVVHTREEMERCIDTLAQTGLYGTEFMVEPYMDGEEITISVFPDDGAHSGAYSLVPVVRFNHTNGVAPYNGVQAVSENSRAAKDAARYGDIMRACARAFDIMKLKAPIRIDCRADEGGVYRIFDVNLKPNMTLASRPHRQNQDSLVMIAASASGMERIDLLRTFMNTAWSGGSEN